MENRQIADVFTEIADILDIKGDNPFRIRSYRNAARAVGDMSENVAAMVREGKDIEQIRYRRLHRREDKRNSRHRQT